MENKDNHANEREMNPVVKGNIEKMITDMNKFSGGNTVNGEINNEPVTLVFFGYDAVTGNINLLKNFEAVKSKSPTGEMRVGVKNGRIYDFDFDSYEKDEENEARINVGTSIRRYNERAKK